ncbi:MAG: Asp23/Gls24 family envelope stress response protein [Clostridiales Family XIII bacterium]|nr:Asp23/Gls24 family envelope stress response protein [Clostridiales Family XIII bacterium]
MRGLASGANTESLGAVSVSDEVIAACVREALAATDGVHDFFGGFSGALSQNILGKEPRSKGIRISREDEGLAVDVQVIVEYGVKIPEIAWNLQRNIKNEIEGMTDADVKSVNIAVQGVRRRQEGAS